MRQLILDIRPDAPPDFDNFLAGANLEALLALRAWAETEPTDRILYLWGGPGTGKSHLLRAAAAASSRAGRTCCLVHDGAELPDELSGLLLVDDVQALSEADQIILFNLINQAREGAGRVVASGDAPPQSLRLRQDLTTRLAWGLVMQLHPISDRDKLDALRQRAAARGLAWPEEAGRHLLTHCRRDLPHLLAVVDALDEFSLSRKRPLTLALVRDYFLDAG